MALNIDYIAGKQSIDKLREKLHNTPLNKQEKLVDDIILTIDALLKRH